MLVFASQVWSDVSYEGRLGVMAAFLNFSKLTKHVSKEQYKFTGGVLGEDPTIVDNDVCKYMTII